MSLNIGTRLQIYEKLKNRIDFSTLFAYYLTLFNIKLPFRNNLVSILVPLTEIFFLCKQYAYLTLHHHLHVI